MTPERHQQIKQIFLAACSLEADAAAALLDRECADDPDLRREVESLLEHHLSATLIKTPAEDTQSGAAEAKTERFPPGSVVAGRYRILGLLGRGGMGVVYRADDLKLDQPVALKFLSPERCQDAAWLRRYENEVRLARKVAHPNVVRVYDIVETQGEVFIVMEYVDGEDLGSLLRRIGRLTGDKAVEIARHVCAGVGAAHDQGVLHRDLKPANILIDSRGQVRVADFGIAAAAEEMEAGGLSPGTPIYMAPELFDGGRPSIRSDLYALGMVLYEAATGQPPFDGRPPTASDRPAAPIRPSAIVPYIHPALESAILQCLDRDPRRRPESAYTVAAMLPGTDPLSLALAAGDTPSPSMVAAAGSGILAPMRVAVAWLAAGLAALCVVVFLADRTFFLPQAGLSKPPDVLADRAEQIVKSLDHEPPGEARWHGFALYGECPPAVHFWYRAGDEQIVVPRLLGQSPAADALSAHPGTIRVRLDGSGRLRKFLVTPERTQMPETHAIPADWSPAFAAAGLAPADFQPVPPLHQPPRYADHVAAWEQRTGSGGQGQALHVEGASLGGRIVFFDVTSPNRGDGETAYASCGFWPVLWRAPLARLGLNLAAVLCAGSLAWYNFRRGRGDHRGARRLAVFVLLLGLSDWLLGERHFTSLGDELASLYAWTARGLLTAAIAWLCYFAVEPYVRRYWPQIMISWSRVLRGKFRDPLVGRDMLVGGTSGILLVLALQLDQLLPQWLGLPLPLPRLPNALYDLGAVLGLRYKLGILITVLMSSITLALVVLLLMLVARVVIRPAWLAIATAWIALTSIQALAAGPDTAFPWVVAGLLVLAVLLLLTRAGLVAVISALFVLGLLLVSPLTANFRAWYAPASTLGIVLAAGWLLYGFTATRAGRPLLWRRLLEGKKR